MNLVLLFIGTVTAVELFFRLPIIESGHIIKSLIGKSLRVISSNKISDHWKETVLASYSGKLLFSSISMLIFVLLAIGPLMLISLAAPLFEIDFYEYISSWTGVVLSTAVAVVYYYARKRIYNV